MDLDEVISRRLRQPPPENCTVVPRSTPVIAFGRFRTARVATVSLNPSYMEFELVDGKRRFHTLDSLGISKYEDFDEARRDMLLDYCERYFERPGIYYGGWFDRVENFIRSSINASYFDGSACHLDISQWATEDVWDDLTSQQRNAIVSNADLELVRELIVQGPYTTILLNGAKAAKRVLRAFNIRYQTVKLRDTFSDASGKTKYKVEVYSACINELLGKPLGREVEIVGWNFYIKYAGEDSLGLVRQWMAAQQTREMSQQMPKVDLNSCQCLRDLIKSASDTFMERVGPSIDEAANQGWFILDPYISPYWVPLMSRAMASEGQISPKRFVDLLYRTMRRYYLTRDNIEAMREKWSENKWSEVRWPIFLEAIDCYKRGAYYASVSTTAPLVEGIITGRNEMKPFSAGANLKKRVREIDPSGKLAQIVDNFFVDTRSLDDFIEGSLNRHAILHGVDVKFGTQIKALQNIAMVNALVHI